MESKNKFMTTKRFNCSMGRREKIFSWIIIIGLFMFPIINVFTIGIEDSTIIIALIILAIVIFVYAFSPRYITVGNDVIIIKRLFKDRIIITDGVIAIGRKEKSDFRRDVKLFGAAGLLGYYGFFRSKDHGKYYCISNNEENNVIIVTTTGSYVISCDNPQEMMEKVSEFMQKK